MLRSLSVALLLVGVRVSSQAATPCPAACTCDAGQTNLLTVNCPPDPSRRRLPLLLPTTQQLNFSGSGLQYLDEESFRGYQYIQLMDLSRNQIESLGAGSFAGLPRLTLVDLQDNIMEFIYPAVFTGMKSPFVRVRISGNPWHCNCALKKVWNEIRATSNLEVEEMVCASPKEHRGRALSTVNDICDEELSGHDIAIIVIMFVTLISAVVLHFLDMIVDLVKSRLLKSRDEDYEQKPRSNGSPTVEVDTSEIHNTRNSLGQHAYSRPAPTNSETRSMITKETPI